MKKVVTFALAMLLAFSFCSVALAKTSDQTVTDSDGNPIDWIEFKLHPYNEYTPLVDIFLVNPIYDDYNKAELYAAAEAAYPGIPAVELGCIAMGGYDPEYDYIFDYFGPFTATVYNSDIHCGDKVALLTLFAEDEGQLTQVKAFRVKNGSFSFRADAPCYCVYVVLHKGNH